MSLIEIAKMWRTHSTHRVCGPIRSTPCLFAGLVAAVLLGSPTATRSSEAVLTLRPTEPGATVWMLSAPQTGKRMCEVPASTPIKFMARARHGPHHYARVEVLEGDCAGKQGYVPWTTLEPEPRED